MHFWAGDQQEVHSGPWPGHRPFEQEFGDHAEGTIIRDKIVFDTTDQTRDDHTKERLLREGDLKLDRSRNQPIANPSNVQGNHAPLKRQ